MRLVIMFQVMQLLLQLSSLTPVSSARSLVFNLSPQRVAEVIHAVSNNVSSYATAPAVIEPNSGRFSKKFGFQSISTKSS